MVVSHTGVQATCQVNRNLSDAQIQRIAANGGVIGIGYSETRIYAIMGGNVARLLRNNLPTGH